MTINRDQLQRIACAVTLPFVPEVQVCGMPADGDFEQFRTQHAAVIGAGVPYWAVAWPGGQALARYLLDQPTAVAGRHVIDIGCGNGLVAAAAMRSGAASAMAVDHDPNALTVAAETARLNAFQVGTSLGSLETLSAAPGTVICAGDLWYEPQTGKRATSALAQLAEAGVMVLCGDPGRPGRPRKGAVELARYEIPVSTQFEADTVVNARVFALGAEPVS